MSRGQVTGPTQTASDQIEGRKWERHPWIARVIRFSIFIFPVVVSVLASLWASRKYPPEEIGVNRWIWWIGLAALAMGLVRVLERLLARVTPLTLLFRMSLIFPDQAPSRFSIALKTGSPRALKRRLDQIQESGEVFDNEQAFAGQMLELVAVLAKHDRMTRGHAERVRAYSELIGEEMGLDESDLGKLRWSALLHDMGKLHVPSEILNKDGRPTDEEWAILKAHPAKADEYLEPLAEWLGEWRFAAVGHHERWDGNGYPLGQQGNEIPLSARIVAVADAFDVMTSTRSYKKPMPAELARQEVADKAGSQFDPAVSRAFLNIGLGDLRRTAGPLAFLTNLPIFRGVPLTQAVTTAASNATSAAIGAAAVAIAALVGTPDPPAPPELAFVESAVPEIAADNLVGAEDEQIAGSINIFGEGPFTITIVEPPSLGNATIPAAIPIDATNPIDFTYTPEPDRFGPDEFRIQVCDSQGGCTERTIAIDVLPANDVPTIAPPSLVVREGEAAFVALSVNDLDDDQLTITIEEHPENARISIEGTTLRVIHDGSETSEVNLTLVLSDGTSSVIEPVTVPVTPVNDPPALAVTPINVEENSALGTPAGSASATDPEAGPITYSITGGSPSDLFAIDAGTGELTVAGPIDFEGTPEITLTITATDDAGDTTSQTMTVPIDNVNEPPVFQENGPLSVTENSPVGTRVANGTVSATDPEGDQITYAIIDLSNTFAVDSNAAILSTAQSTLDFEATSTYTATVLASDAGSGQQSSQSITISIVNVNEAPTLNPLTVAPVPENIAIGTIVGQAAGADEDGDSLSFSIVGGTGQNVFAVDPATGELSVAMPLDYETTTSYTLTIALSDGQTPALSDSTFTLVDITNVNDPPVITSGQVRSIAENTPTGTPLTGGPILAIDPESGPTITYSIDDPLSLFTIDPTTGELTRDAAPLDFESVPTHQVTITATDSLGASSNELVDITILDRNDAPVITAFAAPLTIAENQPAQVLDQATVVDADGDSLAFSLSGPDAALFVVDNDGQISTLGPLDFETQSTYNLTLTVVDDGQPAANATTPITIQVDPVNEAPIVKAGQVFAIEENSPIGSPVGPPAALASDVDGDALIYSLTDPTNSFAINPSTGEITLIQTVDHEATPVLEVTIHADDGGLQDSELAEIIVQDINEAPTLIIPTSPVDVAELRPAGFDVAATITASDPEGDTLTFSLNDPSGLFTIDSVSGMITVAAPLDFETTPNFYELTVSVDDLASGGLSTVSQAVTIQLTDENEAPMLVGGTTFSIAENSVAGDTTLPSAAQAVDVDGDTVSFSLNDPTDSFTIDPTTGVLSLTPLGTAIDFETRENYPVTITVTDPDNLTDTVAYTVVITNVNEPPTLTAPANVSVAENSPLTTSVTAAISATDPENDTLTFGLIDLSNTFAIDPATGEIAVAAPLDFETLPDTYAITVTVDDTATGGTSTDSTAMTITITDAPEAPVITTTAIADVNESTPPTTIVDTVAGTDDDAQPITWAITGGTGEGIFTINATTGEVTLAVAVDYDTGPTSYTLTVTATDPDSLTDTANYIVTITNTNEPPVVAPGQMFEIPENSPITTPVTFETTPAPVSYADPENDPANWSIADPTSTFNIDPSTGQILLAGSVDFETQTKFVVTVTAETPDTITSSETVTIDVTPVNEAPTLVLPGTIPIVDENQPTGLAVTTASASDPESDVLSYQPLTGSGAAFFTINPMTGEITTTGSLDYELANQYQVDVTVTDGLLSDTQTLRIDVGNLNDAPIIDPGQLFSIVDDQPVNTTLTGNGGFVTASDPDGNNFTYAIVGGNPAGHFAISNAGELTLATAINFDDASTYTLTIEATDNGAPAMSSTETVDITVTSQFGQGPSPHFGEVTFNEVYYVGHITDNFEFGLIPLIDYDFVELINQTGSDINLNGWTLSDSPLGQADPIATFAGTYDNAFNLPANGRMVQWMSSILGFTPAAPGADLVAVFPNNVLDTEPLQIHDDLFLYDENDLLVAYMAWGDANDPNSDITVRPPINTWNLWNPANEIVLGLADRASIALTPDGTNATNSNCWEETQSGDAAITCTGAPTTVSTSGNANAESVGTSNN